MTYEIRATYEAYRDWRKAARALGATLFEGDIDICQAFNVDRSVWYGEWNGGEGTTYTKDGAQ